MKKIASTREMAKSLLRLLTCVWVNHALIAKFLRGFAKIKLDHLYFMSAGIGFVCFFLLHDPGLCKTFYSTHQN